MENIIIKVEFENKGFASSVEMELREYRNLRDNTLSDPIENMVERLKEEMERGI